MDKLYEFNKQPDNVRQMGELREKNKVYFEDYVVTYMDRIFQRDTEKAIVVYVGKEGVGECAGNYFIYGAIETDFELADAEPAFSAVQWEEIKEDMENYFPGGQILGWGVGIHMENSSLKNKLREIQKKNFSAQYQICMVFDQSEETKTLYSFDGLQFRKQKGYMVYYGKNPQMQNFMLRGVQKESMEAAYKDDVVASVRAAVQRNEEKKNTKKKKSTAAAAFFLFLMAAGGLILLQSNRKLERLEETLAVVSMENQPIQIQTILPAEESTEKIIEPTMVSPTEKPTVAPTERQLVIPTTKPIERQSTTLTTKPMEPTMIPPTTKPIATQTAIPTEHQSTTPTETPAERQSVIPTEMPTEHPTKSSKEKSTKKSKSEQQTAKPSSLTHYSYIVQKGDTLGQIVWRQYRDMSKLSLVKERNHIVDENQIQVGQRLILPIYD